MRVVIAEDLALLRDGLTRLLESNGYEVLAAVVDGDALIEAVEEHRPDVCVVDVRLPPTFRDEGVRAALEARRRVPGLPVLVLSQYVERTYAAELLSDGRGGVCYLLKERVADPSDFVDAGPLSSVASRSGGGDKHADESPSRRRGPRALVSISVSPTGATANNQPSRKVKRDRPRSPCRLASSAARPVVIAEVLEGTTGGTNTRGDCWGVRRSGGTPRFKNRPGGGSALGCGLLAGAEQARAVAPGPGSALTLHANDIASKVRRRRGIRHCLPELTFS